MKLVELVGEIYKVNDGGEIRREYNTFSPNGNLFDGKWVYRNAEGFTIDFDRYRNDLFARNYLTVKSIDQDFT